MRQGWVGKPCAKCKRPLILPIEEYNKSPYCKSCQEDIQAEQPVVRKKMVKVLKPKKA